MGHWDYWPRRSRLSSRASVPDLLADAIVDGRTGSVELHRAAS